LYHIPIGKRKKKKGKTTTPMSEEVREAINGEKICEI